MCSIMFVSALEKHNVKSEQYCQNEISNAVLTVEEWAMKPSRIWGLRYESQSRVGPRVCHRGLWGSGIVNQADELSFLCCGDSGCSGCVWAVGGRC